jgi:hypothetical protein
METTGPTKTFLESIQIPCDVCASITCDGFHTISALQEAQTPFKQRFKNWQNDMVVFKMTQAEFDEAIADDSEDSLPIRIKDMHTGIAGLPMIRINNQWVRIAISD